MTRETSEATFLQGFPLERPPVMLDWGITEKKAVGLLDPAHTQRVVSGQLRVRSRVLGGMDASIELLFEPRPDGRLVAVELLRSPSRGRRKAFEALQARLIARLGAGVPAAVTTAAQLDDITPWRWELGRLTVTHDYYYHFALYEKVLFSWRP